MMYKLARLPSYQYVLSCQNITTFKFFPVPTICVSLILIFFQHQLYVCLPFFKTVIKSIVKDSWDFQSFTNPY